MRTHDIFPALWISDVFMERVKNNSDWTLFDPYETQDLCYLEMLLKKDIQFTKMIQKVKKKLLNEKTWKQVLQSYFESGNPETIFMFLKHMK